MASQGDANLGPAKILELRRHVLLPVQQQAAAVISEMRKNAKWAPGASFRGPAGRFVEEDQLLDDLLRIRFSQLEWVGGTLTARAVLSPFLAIVKSAEASGPITAAALVAVRHLLLASNLLAHFSEASTAAAMHDVVAALTVCKFEATSSWHDQMVLCKILQALDACLSCPSGSLLGDADVCAIFQATYRIGFDTHVVADLSDLLVDLVKDSLVCMVRTVFARLREPPLRAATQPASWPVPDVGSPPTPAPAHAATTNGGETHRSRTSARDGSGAGGASGTGNGLERSLEARSVPSDELAAYELAEDGDIDGGGSGWMRVAAMPHGSAAGAPLDRDATAPLPESFGARSAGHILTFLVKLVQIEPMCHFALALLDEAVCAASSSLLSHPVLLRQLQIDLPASLLAVFAAADASAEAAGARAARETVASMSRVVLSLYLHLRPVTLLQVELFVQSVLVPLAQGRLLHGARGHTPAALVEAALEALTDFCIFPGFLHDAYAFLDCRIERSNLFEAICSSFTRAIVPRAASRGVLPINTLAVTGLRALLQALLACEGQPAAAIVAPAGLFACHARSDLWHAIIRGEEPACEGLMAQLTEAAPPNGAASGGQGQAAWAELCAIRRVQWEKTIKTKLADAVEQLNDDYKRGFQFMQVNRLMPDPMDAASVASLLRFARGVDKQVIGNFMGKADSFNQEVMAAFVSSLPLAQLDFDTAFRAFADTFKQPPESQQVVRFTKSFTAAFLEAHSGEYRGFRTLKCLDDFMTICLWHNSTWYNANPRVPKMSTARMLQDALSESISKFDEPDPRLVHDMWASICDTAFPQGQNEAFRLDLPRARLAVLAERSTTARGQAPSHGPLLTILSHDMFHLVWGTAVRGVAALLERAHPDDGRSINDAMSTLFLIAAVGKAARTPDVVDALVAAVSPFTAAADPSAPYPHALSAFGTSRLAQAAVTTLFAIAAEHADMLRAGWPAVLDCLLRLHKLRLVDTAALVDAQAHGGASGTGGAGTPLSQSRPASPSAATGGNLLSFLFAAPAAPAELTAAEAAAEGMARACVRRCRIEAIFDDSKFLQPEALQALVQAVALAGGPPAESIGGGGGSSGGFDDGGSDGGGTAEADSVALSADPEAAEACLELLIKLAVRNRDRIQLLLPSLTAHIRRIIAATSPGTVRLTQRAIGGWFRVCTRLLMYRHDVTGELLACLKALTALHMGPGAPPHMRSVAPAVATALHGLLTACAERIEAPAAWDTLLQLLRNSCCEAAAVPPALATLDHLCRAPRCLAPTNFLQVVTTVSEVVSRASAMLLEPLPVGAPPPPFAVAHVRGGVDLLEAAGQWLQTWRQRQAQASALPARSSGDMQRRQWAAELSTFWHHLLEAIARACADGCEGVRGHALVVLHRCLTTAKEHLHLPPAAWGTTWREIMLPMLAALASALQDASHGMAKAAGGAGPLAHSLCLAINVLHKTFVAHIAELSALREWRSIWLSTLQGLKMCASTAEGACDGADVQAAVAQAVAGMVQTMHMRKLLWGSARDRDGLNMWDRTFSIIQEISVDLTPEKLGVA